jgi:hypothetical protein
MPLSNESIASKSIKDDVSSAKPKEKDEVSEAALDQVVGGINPQPLPPLERKAT